jgi:hypothetical protein
MAEASLLVTRAAETFGLDTARLGRLGGNSGYSWDAGEHVLRAGSRAVMDRELAAVAAVSAVLPVPRVIGRADFADGSAVLLESCPDSPRPTWHRPGPPWPMPSAWHAAPCMPCLPQFPGRPGSVLRPNARWLPPPRRGPAAAP